MTSPVTDDYAQRLKVAGQAVGTSNPQLAVTLASSGLTSAQMQAIGGFTNALGVHTANQLALDSGVQTNWSTQEQNQAGAIGTTLTGAQAPTDGRNWLEKAAGALGNAVADGGNFIFHNPITHGLMTGLNWLGNVAHMPFRLASATVGGEDQIAKNAEMQALGYDPNSTVSSLAFMFSHGDSEYHDLSHVRDTYGDDLVDLAVQMQADPEQFQKDYQNMDPAAAAEFQTKINSEAFKQASMAIDARHISPGRDLANLVLSPFGVHTEDNAVFKLISGVADAAYDWISDPTLILGRVSQGMRAASALGEATDQMSLTTRLMTKAAGGEGALAAFVQKRAGGLANALDKNSIYKTLGVDPDTKQVVAQTVYSKAWQGFLDRASAMRDRTEIINSSTASAEEKAAATTERAAILATMTAAHPTLMPLLDEVNGTRIVAPQRLEFDDQGILKVEQQATKPASAPLPGEDGAVATQAPPTASATAEADKVVTDRSGQKWVATSGKPITEMGELADYLASTGGLLRLTNGQAAAETMVMPGRVSWWAERMAVRKGDKAEKWINYVDGKLKMLPTDEELPALTALDPADADMSMRARLGQAQHNLLRSGTADGQGFAPMARARVRLERLNRRISTVLPDVKQFDLTDASTVRDVEQFARFYLDKGQARLMAAAYAAGDLGTRRQVVRGMVRQSMHAAGLGRSPAGRKFMDDYLKDVDQQKYGLEDTDLVATDRGPIHGALYNSQLSTTVPMPSLKQMNQLAVRYAVDSWASKTGLTAGMGALQSNRMDALYGHIKMGWITSAAGGLRNALDEVAGYLAKGMGRQYLQGRVAYTQATEAVRAQRVEARQAYKDVVDEYGPVGANDYIARTSHQAGQGLDAAQRAYDRALAGKGELSIDDATDALGAAQEDARQARLLESAIQHKIPYAFRRTADTINHVVVGVTLGKVLRMMGPKWTVDEQAVRYAQELHNETLRSVLSDGIQQTHYADNYGAIAGPEYAMDLHRNGVAARRYSFTSNGWDTVEPDGGQGLDAFAKYLGLRFSDPNEAGHAWVQTMHAMRSRKVAGESRPLAEPIDTGRQGTLRQHWRKADPGEATPETILNELENGRMVRLGKGPNGGMELHSPEDFTRFWSQGIISDEDIRAGDWRFSKLDDSVAPEAQAFDHEQNFWSNVEEHGLAGVDADTLRQYRELRAAEPEPGSPEWEDPSEPWLTQIHQLRASILREHLRHRMDLGHKAEINYAEPGEAPNFEPLTPDSLDEIPVHVGGDPYHPLGAEAWRYHVAEPTSTSSAEALNAARDAVRAHLDTPEMRPFIANAEVVKTLRDGTKVTTPELLGQAKDELADRISADLMHGLFSRPGEGGAKINDALLDHLAQAKEIGTPDASWIKHNVPEDERPAQTIGQLWAAYNPAHVPGQMPRGYAAIMSKVYDKVVNDYVDAASRNPLVTALYINARRNTEPWQQHLVEQGWSEEAAAEAAQKMAYSHAEQESYKHIDNPHVASQFSLISRNFLTFERAQEDWLRRWGRAIKDNPSIIRKGQLALHAGTSTGMVEQDPTTGQLNFVYPGSQLAIRGFNAVMRGMGLGDQVQIPVLGELTSQLTYLSPSLNQPFGTTASPIISIPFKAIAATVGQDHQLLMSDLDTILNGQMGAGQNWYSMILPPSINRIIRGVVQSDPASQYGHAYANAVHAMGATGAFDKLDGTDPTAISNTSDALGAQVRNNMLLNVLFGFFAPAAPAVDFDGHSKAGSGTEADWSAHKLGYSSLKQEAQKALADLGPTRFRLWWAATHPKELIWDPTANSSTKGGTANAYLPATINAAKWFESNPYLLHNYGGKGGVGAYFVPSQQDIVGRDAQGNPIIGPDTTGLNSYNQIAYRAQLQDHMRSYKNLEDLIPDVILQRGEQEYYKVKDSFDAQISAATNANDQYTAKQLTQQWADAKKDIYARNPLLAEKNASYATNGAVQAVSLAQLRRLVADPQAVKAIGPGSAGDVQTLLDALDQYNATDQALSGRVGSAATTARAQLRETYAAQVAAVAQQNPDLADLVKGVFRTP